MEKEKLKKLKRMMASVVKRRKQSSRQDAKNGEDKKADPQHKEMVESDKDFLPDEIPAEEQNIDSLEENSQATLGQNMFEYGIHVFTLDICSSYNLTVLFVFCFYKAESLPNDEKLLKDLPSEGYQKLVEHLQPLSATGRDYRSLADRMGYTNQYIQWLGSTDNPVMNLLRKFRGNDRKISELTSLLKEMERYDVLQELQPYIGQ